MIKINVNAILTKYNKTTIHSKPPSPSLSTTFWFLNQELISYRYSSSSLFFLLGRCSLKSLRLHHFKSIRMKFGMTVHQVTDINWQSDFWYDDMHNVYKYIACVALVNHQDVSINRKCVGSTGTVSHSGRWPARIRWQLTTVGSNTLQSQGCIAWSTGTLILAENCCRTFWHPCNKIKALMVITIQWSNAAVTTLTTRVVLFSVVSVCPSVCLSTR